MGKLRKIALIMCASNFERQRRVVHEVHDALKEMGEYALYVFTNYGIFYGDSPYIRGAKSIYQLIKEHDFDGCIIDSNLGEQAMLQEIADEVRRCNIPIIGLNVVLEGIPFIIMDAYSVQSRIMEHLIHVHHCTKINIMGFDGDDIFSERALQAYKEVLEREGLPFEEKRIVKSMVSIENGKSSYDKFIAQGAGDADATIFLHDVWAIGFCLRMEELGKRVPEDMCVFTLNYSSNSVGFRPKLAGADRQDAGISRKACELLCDVIDGKEVQMENYYEGKLYFAQSCGCDFTEEEQEKKNTSGYYSKQN